MARKSTNTTPVDDESNLTPAPPAAAVEVAAETGQIPPGAVNVSTSEGDSLTPAISLPSDQVAGDMPAGNGGDITPAEQVKALVLHDSIYGRCGEVREFDASAVDALKDAGYIDPHPKAVEWAEG
ncbi:hypothetical protein [Bordetella bronchiseptica]|uniref:hypothetical protein n=1 Tax=Bordetella bronchiseptica TaxID=518 RepID=UPI001268F32F|nr:hypothetical protein [Bordetella bronchiseptica]